MKKESSKIKKRKFTGDSEAEFIQFVDGTVVDPVEITQKAKRCVKHIKELRKPISHTDKLSDTLKFQPIGSNRDDEGNL